MIVIVLYHSGMFWTGHWFTAMEPAEQADGIALFTEWLGTFHIYAFALISGYIYYYVRYQRGGYDNPGTFIRNKIFRLLVPYICVAVLWVIPLNAVFYPFNIDTVITKFILGEAPSQLWFLLMLFGVFMIAYPLSDFFRLRPHLSAILVLGLWFIGVAASTVLPNIYQIFTAMQYTPFFWLGFELRRRNHFGYSHNGLKFNVLMGGGNLLINILLFIAVLSNPFDGITAKAVNVVCSFGSSIAGALMAFSLLMALASVVNWRTPFMTAFSAASFPIYLFHQQIIYFVLWYLNGQIPPLLLMLTSFVIATGVSWGIYAILKNINCLRPIIGLKRINSVI